MRIPGITAFLLIAIVLVIGLLVAGAFFFPPSVTDLSSGRVAANDSPAPGKLAAMQEETVLFSKYVDANSPPILVDLNTGEAGDPFSLMIITPDGTLGPFDDGSDGRIDGRIYLRIARPEGSTPGLWKFVVRTDRHILIGDISHLPWINTSIRDHKPDEGKT